MVYLVLIRSWCGRCGALESGFLGEDAYDLVIVSFHLWGLDGFVSNHVFALHGAGEGYVVHALVLLIHVVLGPANQHDMWEFEPFCAVDRGQYDVRGLIRTVVLGRFVLRREQSLFHGVDTNLITQHAFFREVHEVREGDLAVLVLTLPHVNRGLLIVAPGGKRTLNNGLNLIGTAIGHIGQLAHQRIGYYGANAAGWAELDF